MHALSTRSSDHAFLGMWCVDGVVAWQRAKVRPICIICISAAAQAPTPPNTDPFLRMLTLSTCRTRRNPSDFLLSLSIRARPCGVSAQTPDAQAILLLSCRPASFLLSPFSNAQIEFLRLYLSYACTGFTDGSDNDTSISLSFCLSSFLFIFAFP